MTLVAKDTTITTMTEQNFISNSVKSNIVAPVQNRMIFERFVIAFYVNFLFAFLNVLFPDIFYCKVKLFS